MERRGAMHVGRAAHVGAHLRSGDISRGGCAQGLSPRRFGFSQQTMALCDESLAGMGSMSQKKQPKLLQA